MEISQEKLDAIVSFFKVTETFNDFVLYSMIFFWSIALVYTIYYQYLIKKDLLKADNKYFNKKNFKSLNFILTLVIILWILWFILQFISIYNIYKSKICNIDTENYKQCSLKIENYKN